MLDPAFVADCPYEPEAIFFDEIVELDREAGRIVARYGRLATIGPPLLLECRATRLRRLQGTLYVRYVFGFEQEGAVVYESDQGAAWQREGDG